MASWVNYEIWKDPEHLGLPGLSKPQKVFGATSKYSQRKLAHWRQFDQNTKELIQVLKGSGIHFPSAKKKINFFSILFPFAKL